jgi:hypothetical protein
MDDNEEVLDCIWVVDETLSEVEEALVEKRYADALHKLREARNAINDLREDDESYTDRQEVEMDMVKRLK